MSDPYTAFLARIRPTAAPMPADLMAYTPHTRVCMVLARGGTLRPNEHDAEWRDLYRADGVYVGTLTPEMVEDDEPARSPAAEDRAARGGW